ncbi:hypothetical protein GCM10009864_44370 [Streptomyces lunalinharesii]|uniref:Uncharacterized protein n=1 Tax=Streptomyces lunalinharesii TaxID=333384 RepID=A0ABP6EKG4_9ACTN
MVVAHPVEPPLPGGGLDGRLVLVGELGGARHAQRLTEALAGGVLVDEGTGQGCSWGCAAGGDDRSDYGERHSDDKK